jgi:hypothetical protein
MNTTLHYFTHPSPTPVLVPLDPLTRTERFALCIFAALVASLFACSAVWLILLLQR